RCIPRQKLAGLLGEVKQDGAGFEETEGRAARPVRIDDRGNLAVWVQRQEFGRPGFILADVDGMRLVWQPHLLQRDRDLDAVRRRKGIELKALGMRRRPARGDREG